MRRTVARGGRRGGRHPGLDHPPPAALGREDVLPEEEAPARAQDPPDLGQRGVDVRHRAQDERRQDDVDCGVLERQLSRRQRPQVDVEPERLRETAAESQVPPYVGSMVKNEQDMERLAQWLGSRGWSR